MAINFPNNPTVNQTHTVGDITWTWDGTTWKSSSPFTETSHDDVVVDGDFVSEGLLKRGSSAGTYSIVADNSANWNTTHGWGNHASAGYLTSIGSITNHSDVSTTNLAPSELLKWSGTQWTNASIDSFTIDADTLDGNQPISFLRSDIATSKTSGNLSFSDDIRLVFGNDSDIQIYHESTSGGVNHIQASAGLTITGQLTAGGLTYPATNGSSGQVLTSDGAGNVTWTTVAGGGGGITAESDTLATVTARGASTNVEIEANGGISIPQGESIDFGTDLSISRFSNQNKARLQYTGPGAFYFEIDDVYFRNDANTRTHMSFEDTSGVRLFHNNNIKLSTTSAGVTVTGTLTAGGLTYPTTNGTSGQVLTSDGSGNVTWSTVSGGGGLSAEADTLDSVTGRGSSTSNNVSFGNISSPQGNITAGGTVSGYFTGSTITADGRLTVINRIAGGNLIYAGYFFNSIQNTFVVDSNANLTLSGSLTAGGLTYPTTNGSSGQVLTSDGAGNVTWSEESVVGTITFSSNGSTNYTFTGTGYPTSTTQTTELKLHAGLKYKIINTTGTNHPLEFRSGGVVHPGYAAGWITGSKSGTQYITVPYSEVSGSNTSITFEYVCTLHPVSMNGTVRVAFF